MVFGANKGITVTALLEHGEKVRLFLVPYICDTSEEALHFGLRWGCDLAASRRIHDSVGPECALAEKSLSQRCKSGSSCCSGINHMYMLTFDVHGVPFLILLFELQFLPSEEPAPIIMRTSRSQPYWLLPRTTKTILNTLNNTPNHHNSSGTKA